MKFSLEKTKQEQALLAQIQKLSNQIQFEPTNQRLIDQHHALKRELENLQSVETPTETIESLREQLQKSEQELDTVKQQYETLREQYGSLHQDEANEPPLRLRNKFYRQLLERFAPLINEHTKKTVGEIKTLIEPKDLSVQSLVLEAVGEAYDSTTQFSDKLNHVVNHLRERVQFVPNDTQVNGWLTPTEALEWGCADEEDLAVLLASVALALKVDEVFVVVAEMEKGSAHAFNLLHHQENFFIIDLTQNHALNAFEKNNAEEALNSFTYQNQPIKRLLYRFNRESYEQFF